MKQILLFILFSKVLIIKWKDTEFYNEAIRGFIENYEGVYEVYDSKESKEEFLKAINKKDYEIIALVGEKSLKTALDLDIDKPIIFFMVYNPKIIIKDKENIKGVSLNISYDVQFQKIKEIFHDKKIGIFYSEDKVVEGVEEAASKHGISIKLIKVQKKEKIIDVLIELKRETQIILVPPDPILSSPEIMSMIVSFGIENKICLFVPSDKLVKAGAAFGLVPDYYENGKIAANLVKDILAGKKTKSFYEMPNAKLYINSNTLKELKINLPQEILKKASGAF
ncbi:MAG: ABC transporter substrate binding protein [Candidatus Hydrothermales bacterium]